MTNLEYILSDAWRKNLIKLITDYTGVREENDAPVLCSELACSECKFCGQPCDSYYFETWLEEEHTEPPAFQEGTIVEVLDGDDTYVSYYNGVYENQHYVVDYKGYIGKSYPNGVPYGTAVKLANLRKVDK